MEEDSESDTFESEKHWKLLNVENNGKVLFNHVISQLVDNFSEFHRILNGINLDTYKPYDDFIHSYLEVSLKLTRLQRIVINLVDVISENRGRDIDKREFKDQLREVKKELVEINNYIDRIVTSLLKIKISSKFETKNSSPDDFEQNLEIFRSRLKDFETELYYTIIMAVLVDIIETLMTINDREERCKQINKIVEKFLELKTIVNDAEGFVNRMLLEDSINFETLSKLNEKLKEINFINFIKNAVISS